MLKVLMATSALVICLMVGAGAGSQILSSLNTGLTFATSAINSISSHFGDLHTTPTTPPSGATSCADLTKTPPACT